MLPRYDHCNVRPSFAFAFARFGLVFLSGFCVLGFPTGLLASTPKSASEAIADIDEILGDPDAFVADIWDGVNAFVSEHFGAMAVATGFGIAIRTITK